MKFKLHGIVTICVVCMVVYINYVNKSYGHVSSTLTNLSTIHFPAQMELYSALHNVEKIERNFKLSISTGDITPIDENDTLVSQFKASIDRLSEIDSSIEDRAKELHQHFFTYYDSARSLAEHLTTNSVIDSDFSMSGLTSRKNYQSLVSQLELLYAEQKKLFDASIERSDAILYKTSRLGYAVGFMISIAMTLLGLYIANSVFNRIDSMVRSLRKIASGSAGMEKRINIEGDDEMSDLAHWFNTFLDKLKQVTEESTARIKEMAYTDQLSGLANRRKLILNLQEYLQTHRDSKDSPLALYYFDLDNFKPINDNYGHDVGDELIRMVSARLLQVFDAENQLQALSAQPENPLLDKTSLIARIGGDEFVIAYPFDGSDQDIEKTNELIKRTITEPYVVYGHQCRVGMSGGVSFFPQHTHKPEDLITYADVAMLSAKRDKYNTIRNFTPDMIEESVDQAQLINAMHNSIRNKELFLVYQPKYDLQSRQLEGIEALIRWQQSELGWISPDVFIPLAESTGFIHEIDRWVLDAVASQISRWEQSHGFSPRVSVNISAIQASNNNLPGLVSDTLQRHCIAAELIEIEITETAAIRNMEVLAGNIDELRALGVRVALDDFGAGNSSLILLQNTSIDTLKLDRSLLTEIDSSDKQYVIVSSIINIATSFGIAVVAEGIETAAQEEALKRLLCKYGQGFLFCEPMTADDFATHYLSTMDKNLKCA